MSSGHEHIKIFWKLKATSATNLKRINVHQIELKKSLNPKTAFSIECETTIPYIKKGRSFDPHLSRLHIYTGVTNGINP